MSSIDNDYSNLINQTKLSNAKSLLGDANLGGLSGDLIQQWAMLGANQAAYRKLLEAQETGAIRQNENYRELMSDRFFNDYYDKDSKQLIKPTYTPSSSLAPAIDDEKTSGDVLADMRTLALAAIGNPDSLNSVHYDFFEKMRQSVADNLVVGDSAAAGGGTAGDAEPASFSKPLDYRLLLEDQRFTVAGKQGDKSYSFAAGTDLEQMVADINADSAETGVRAELTGYGEPVIAFTSIGAGGNEFVRLDQEIGDLFTAAGTSVSANGSDAAAGGGDAVVAGGDEIQAAMAAALYGGTLFDDQTFIVQGARGSEEFSFKRGDSAERIVDGINAASGKTGVTAELIRGASGGVEAIGLLADRAGSGQYVQVSQSQGDLFANAGKTVAVAGASPDTGETGAPVITNLADLGQASLDGVAYSFADLAPGGKASPERNPDAALAVIDQALRDIHAGRAVIEGFDPETLHIPGLTASNPGAQASSNVLEINNYGSDAMREWIARYTTEES